MRQSSSILFAAVITLMSGCDDNSIPKPVRVSVNSPAVASMLSAIALIDRSGLGFAPIPADGFIFLNDQYKPDIWLSFDNSGGHDIFLRKTATGYKYVYEIEVRYNQSSFKPSDGRFHEYVCLEYETEKFRDHLTTNQIYASYTKDVAVPLRDHSLASVQSIIDSWTKH